MLIPVSLQHAVGLVVFACLIVALLYPVRWCVSTGGNVRATKQAGKHARLIALLNCWCTIQGPRKIQSDAVSALLPSVMDHVTR